MSSFVRVLVVVVLVLGFTPGVVMFDGVRQGASGQPSCTDPGRALPVVVVHGFRSDGAAMSDLVAMLEDTAIDVAVETFDYGEDSTWWVTHEQIGPRLRQRLICLADASLAAGGLGRVVVVGHSMGGLATRHALSTDDGDGRGVLVDEIALVATIGTPHQGSVWGVPASLLERTLQTSLTTQMWGQPLPLAGTPAGGALAVGSSQLQRLPDFPADVPVLALASEYVGQSRFLFYRSPEVRIGDAVVSRSSALALSREIAGIGGTEDITCRLNLPLELGPASISAAVSAELVANPAVKDCGHLWQHQAHRLTGEINTHIVVAANQPPRDHQTASVHCDEQTILEAWRTQVPNAWEASVVGLTCADGWARADLLGPDGDYTGTLAFREEDGRWLLISSGLSLRSLCNILAEEQAPGWARSECAAIDPPPAPPTSPVAGAGFVTPSGNIACVDLEVWGSRGIRCQINSGLRPPPDAPCDFDWGGIELVEDGPAVPVCAGDSIMGANTTGVLGYDESWSAGDVSCLLMETGLACQHTKSLLGFSLSRDSWAVDNQGD